MLKGIITNKSKLVKLAVVFLFFLLSFLICNYFSSSSSQSFVKVAQKALLSKEKEAQQHLAELEKLIEANDSLPLFTSLKEKTKDLFKNKGIVLLAYKNDSLTYWSDNAPAVENYMREICLDNNFVQLKNGWYEVVKPSQQKSLRLMALILVKTEFNYQNNYLQNDFLPYLQLPQNTSLSPSYDNEKNQLKNLKGDIICQLQFEAAQSTNNIAWYLSLVLFTGLMVSLGFWLFHFLWQYKEQLNSTLLLSIFLISVILIRFLTLLNKFPEFIYDSELFDPKLFGNADSFWNGFLGDILINSTLVFILSFVVQRHLNIQLKTIRKGLIYILVSSVLIVYSANFINDIIYSLVQNSKLSFNVNNLFGLNVYSFVGFACVGLLLFAFYILCDILVTQILEKKSLRFYALAVFIAIVILNLIVEHYNQHYDLIKQLWSLPLVVFIYFIKKRSIRYSFSYGIGFILIFSFVATHSFIKTEHYKELESRKLYAQQLTYRQDAVTENLFLDIDNKVKKDQTLNASIYNFKPDANELEQYLRQNYFSGYWERFDVVLSVVDSACIPLIKTKNPIHENNEYFEELILKQGSETECKDLFFVETSDGQSKYISRIKVPRLVGPSPLKPYIVYAEIQPKIIPDAVGFPELLLDKSINNNSKLEEYSYAIYKGNKLINRYGKYPFLFEINSNKNNQEFYDYYENDYHHLIYNDTEANVKVIISREKRPFWDKFTTNSYFFMFFSLMLLTFLYLREWRARKNLQNTSLNVRVQLLLVTVVLISLLVFGSGTFWFVNRQFEIKNTELLDEKIKSVLIELQSKLGDQKTLSLSGKDFTAYFLKKFGNVFVTDINAFDLQGNLYASSQPRLFDEGIISRKMNPEAFEKVLNKSFSNFVLKENIGKLNYYSAYQPLYNNSGELLAYINLPYFAKQKELEKEISIYIVALINIYVVLFAISTIMALFISNLVTKPLRMIQQRMSKISFGKTNAPIAWKEKDEIGSLVNEYNKMILQLEESASKLAKSERESAWREMAKQVAHEIKNPLTPMKLSVQHLQRTIEVDPEDLKERVERLTKMLIEQIDTLTNIANEFSSFAKMPKANIEEVNVFESVFNCVQLFEQTENCSIILLETANKNLIANLDKDQCKRVFTNLIKNAIQAIPAEKQGLVEVDIYAKANEVVVKVKDNGSGISPEAIDKIFVPNFSTKTEGMGLGLAMVKNIVESFNGKIWFQTTLNYGTTFYVSFPQVKIDKNSL